MKKYLSASLLALLIQASAVHAATYYVSPSGNDANPGTLRKPFATIAQASSKLKPGDTCYLRKGVYRETLTPKMSGTEKAPITFTSYKGERAILQADDVISRWKKEKDGVYSAKLSWSLDERNQLFVDGQMIHEATWPALGDKPLFKPHRARADGGSKTTLTCKKIPGNASDWKGAELWCGGGAQWICWTAHVTGYDPKTHTLTFEPHKQFSNKWYQIKKGSPFVLRGVRAALKEPGQWYYDKASKRVFVIPPAGKNIKSTVISAKRRGVAINLSARSYIHIRNIEFCGAGLLTDKKSSYNELVGLKGSYVYHLYKDAPNPVQCVPIVLDGHHNLVLNCEFSYSSRSVLVVKGEDNRVINSHIHHGDYSGHWSATVGLNGRRVVFSHNTVRISGRDLINTHHLMESLVQYNDVSEAGYLTHDLGMFYGHNTDFANTEFCYNYVHKNMAKKCAPGIYFDHLSSNALIHHNLIEGCKGSPVQVNNPGYGMMVFNNSAWKTAGTKTFDHSRRNDLHLSRFFNNIFNSGFRLPKSATETNNIVNGKPPYTDPKNGDFRLTKSLGENMGAIPFGEAFPRVGCDLKNPPQPLPVYKPADFPFMNKVINSCFEFGTLEGWDKTGKGGAALVKGNGWGNNHVVPLDPKRKGRPHPTGTMRKEMRLGPGRDGLEQVVKNLTPGGTYVLSAWMRVSDKNEKVQLSVKGYGGKELKAESSSTEWIRKDIQFKVGTKATKATISIEKTTGGKGFAWGDNFLVQKVQ
jgi:hypothetical protein